MFEAFSDYLGLLLLRGFSSQMQGKKNVKYFQFMLRPIVIIKVNLV